MKKINDFFFPLEEGEEMSFHDSVWFYGFITFAITLVIIVVIRTW